MAPSDYTIKDRDFLELWKFHEDRADKIKEAMFKTITWTNGYASALLAFILLSFVTFEQEDPIVSRATAIIVAAVGGLIICFYSFLAIKESERHMEKNWNLAAEYKEHVSGFLTPTIEPEPIRPLARQLKIVVGAFSLVFIFVAGGVMFL